MAAPDITAPVVGGRITAAGFGTQVDNAVAAFASPPRCSVYNTGTQAVGTGGTILTWDSEEYDTDGMHSTSSNTSRLTCVTAGTYTLTAVFSVVNTASSAQSTTFRFIKNGAASYSGGTVVAQGYLENLSVASTETFVLAKDVVLAAADYIEVGFRRLDTATGCFVDSGANTSWLQAKLIAYP